MLTSTVCVFPPPAPWTVTVYAPGVAAPDALMVKVDAPHLSMVSDPDAVTDLIQVAAAHS